jgi:hypothetical protein
MGGWSDRNSERGADFDFYAMAAGYRARAPLCAPKSSAAARAHNLTPNCVTITEQVSDRKEQKFSVRRSARQDSRFGCRQFPAQAFHDQSVDLRRPSYSDRGESSRPG